MSIKRFLEVPHRGLTLAVNKEIVYTLNVAIDGICRGRVLGSSSELMDIRVGPLEAAIKELTNDGIVVNEADVTTINSAILKAYNDFFICMTAQENWWDGDFLLLKQSTRKGGEVLDIDIEVPNNDIVASSKLKDEDRIKYSRKFKRALELLISG